uniref:RNA-binding motif protein, X-linked 2 n=1 Tax=Eptatretus burgeri TaxID=7764 RepID=A0A8C4R4M8_EPTBU
MNPLTKVKLINELNEKEARLGVAEKTSWHKQYRDSAWIFVGGLPYELTEGDIICVFSQYGEIVNVNLVRDKKTGKQKGFVFICYEDQRSTILAVDNFNGIKVTAGRTRFANKALLVKLPKSRIEVHLHSFITLTPLPPPPPWNQLPHSSISFFPQGQDIYLPPFQIILNPKPYFVAPLTLRKPSFFQVSNFSVLRVSFCIHLVHLLCPPLILILPHISYFSKYPSVLSLITAVGVPPLSFYCSFCCCILISFVLLTLNKNQFHPQTPTCSRVGTQPI